MTTVSRPRRTPCPFGFTIRLTEQERIHFEALAQAQGHASIAAAFKAQALAFGMEHPLQEMRLSLNHMASRLADESDWHQRRLADFSQSVDASNSLLADLIQESRSCTEAMILFAQSTEALSQAIAELRHPALAG